MNHSDGFFNRREQRKQTQEILLSARENRQKISGLAPVQKKLAPEHIR
jgi:hypothetical protein